MQIFIQSAALLASTMINSSSAGSLSLETFIAKVLEGPSGRLLEQDVALEVARARGAGLWPNPSLNWNRQSLPGSGVAQSTEDIAWLSVPLVLSGRTFLKAEAAEDAVEAARLLRISGRAQLRQEATALFFKAIAAGARQEAMRATLSRFDSAARILEQRAIAGESSGYDALRLELEVAAIQDRVLGTQLERAELHGRMKTLVGVETAVPSGALVSSEASVAGDQEPLFARLRALSLQVKAAQGRARAAGRLAFPDPVVGAGLVHQGGEGLPGYSGYFIGLQVPLPFFDHGQGRVAEANVQARRLEIERMKLLAAAQASLTEAQQRLELSQQRLKRQLEAQKKGDSLLEIAQRGYALGGMGLLMLLDAEQSALEAKLRAIERAVDVRVAEADVSLLTGQFDDKGEVR